MFLTTCSLLVSCASSSKSRLPDLSQLESGDIAAQVAQNFSKLQNFAGQARVMIEMPGAGYSGYSSVYINMPDSVYVKTEAILGIDVGDLFVDGKYFAAYAPRENVLYYGERELLDLRSFLEVEISTDELYEVFTGLVQIQPDSGTVISYDDDKLLLTSVVSGNTTKTWIDPKRYVVTKSQLLSNENKIILEKEFRRFRKKKNVYVPQIIKLLRPQARERITVYYTSLNINKAIDPGKFRMKPSSNARKVYWGDVSNIKVDRESLNNK
jgi:hypothetical protein